LEVQLSARKTNFGQLFDAVGLSGPLPRGHRIARHRVTSPYPTWATALTDLTGRSTLRWRPGSSPGLDVAKFRELAGRNGSSILASWAKARFAFESARFEAMIADGEADLKPPN
jgi:AsmA protein